MKYKIYYVFFLLLIATVVSISSCSHNKIYRNNVETVCVSNCTDSAIEHHKEYDLTFVEFSDRGNLFDRKQLNAVLDYIKKKESEDQGVMLVVYAHGWQHNASGKTGDVEKFRKALISISKVSQKVFPRKVIGLYIGWRGKSLDLPFSYLNFASYWDRKSVARQVGTGGVSELLVHLNKITKNEAGSHKNVFVISGHSFGAALILSSMKDILIYHTINTKKVLPSLCQLPSRTFFGKRCAAGCYKGESFSDSIVLINPAVEANELFQLKELTTNERCYSRKQPKLLHILSSEADFANKYAFPVGQYFGVSLLYKEETLERKVYPNNPDKEGKEGQKKSILIKEGLLDRKTIGNYSKFITGRSIAGKYIPCEGGDNCGEILPVSPFEPISLIKTDKEFINDHNDISNAKVLAYITAAVVENQDKRDTNVGQDKAINALCFKGDWFNFKDCFDNFYQQYKGVSE
ncbi:MAG: hypothetical protein KAH03_01705 [Cocleimonas sp.]|nr:hypothetical protein [Cocleimonas sp.]